MDNKDAILRQGLDYLANASLPLAVTALILNIIILIWLIIVLTPESVTIKDYIRKFRWGNLSFLVIFLVSLIPVGYYYWFLVQGIDNEDLRNLSRIASRYGPLAITIAYAVNVAMVRYQSRKIDGIERIGIIERIKKMFRKKK